MWVLTLKNYRYLSCFSGTSLACAAGILGEGTGEKCKQVVAGTGGGGGAVLKFSSDRELGYKITKYYAL